MARHSQWHVAGAAAWLLLPVAAPVAIAARLAERLGWKPVRKSLTAEDVAGYIDEFLRGRGGVWDWDDFTSIPLSDPQLEALRRAAERVRLPLDDAGRAKLASLLEQARSL